MVNAPRSNRMTTGIERTFRQTQDGLWREVYLHFIHFINDEGKVISSKLDKTILGKLYKVANGNERSQYGEVEYTLPGTDKPVRLVALGLDRADTRYGRF
jgi:hypothetical protein